MLFYNLLPLYILVSSSIKIIIPLTAYFPRKSLRIETSLCYHSAKYLQFIYIYVYSVKSSSVQLLQDITYLS